MYVIVTCFSSKANDTGKDYDKHEEDGAEGHNFRGNEKRGKKSNRRAELPGQDAGGRRRSPRGGRADGPG